MTQLTIGNAALAQMLEKAREASNVGLHELLSTGEKLACALILNRPDWQLQMQFSIAEAMEPIGPEWCA